MADQKILALRKKLEASPSLTDEEFARKMSPSNDEDNIDNLKYDQKNYDILDHIVV